VNKKAVLLVLALLLSLIILVFGKQFYDFKISHTKADSIKSEKIFAKQSAKEQEQIKAKNIAETKAIYNKHKDKTLVYSPFGDSLGVGLYASSKNNRYVSVLSNLIHKKMGYDVKIMPGSTVSGSGLTDNGIPNIQKIISEKPDLVTIEFGTNDSDGSRSKYLTPDQFKIKLETVVDELQKQKKSPKIILVTTWNIGQKSIAYDSVIETVGKEKNVHVADISSVWSNRIDTITPKGDSTPFGISDGFHPNDRGHKEIAEAIYKKAYDLLK
jgi:acyl-CoA thioesterase-1